MIRLIPNSQFCLKLTHLEHLHCVVQAVGHIHRHYSECSTVALNLSQAWDYLENAALFGGKDSRMTQLYQWMLDELLENPAMLQVFTANTNTKPLLQPLWDTFTYRRCLKCSLLHTALTDHISDRLCVHALKNLWANQLVMARVHTCE